MADITLSEEELKNKLKTQLQFLKKSFNPYRQGETNEAIRIAQFLRVILNN